MTIEKRLKTLKTFDRTEGVPDSFVSNLKNEIIARDRKQQNLINSVSGLIVAFVIGFGLYFNNPDSDKFDMSQIIIDLSEESDTLSVFDDEDFVLASIDYLVAQSDFMVSGWELIEDLSLYEYIEKTEINSFEERS